MHWRTFFIYNAAGGILWATTFGLIGYYAGRFFNDNFSLVERFARDLSWTIGGVIVLGVAIVVLIVYIRRKRQASKS